MSNTEITHKRPCQTGKAHVYKDHVDTDVIIPARYLNNASLEHLAKYCMIDIDPNFSSTIEKDDVIIAGKNFGCGSSREHAPLAIKASGISCVLAKSFARIFHRNAINIGLSVIEIDTDALAAKSGDVIKINWELGVVVNKTAGRQIPFVAPPPFIHQMASYGGLLPYLSQRPKAETPPKRSYKLTALPGDGIGPEIMAEAVKVLRALEPIFNIDFEIQEAPVGGAGIDTCGVPLPAKTLNLCRESDAVLLGAVGGPQWDHVASAIRPETGLLSLRKSLGLYCNLRPVKLFESLKEASPLKEKKDQENLDLLIVRELTGGIYFGEKGTESATDNPSAYDVERYSHSEVDRIAQIAFQLAKGRNSKVTSIDKANVLESSKLWRSRVSLMSETYKDIALNHQYVDNCAMQLILDPHQFDVILTSNLFGDILSDEASTLAGSIGLMPSASLGQGNF